MSSPRPLPSLAEAAAALKYTEDETKKLTKTAITFIVAGVAFVLYSIAAWISGPAPLTPAMAELDEVAAGEVYRAGGLSLLLEEAYVEPSVLGDEVKMRFEVAITNHGTAPFAPSGPTRPVYFSGLSWTVEEAMTADFVPDWSGILADPGIGNRINPGTAATVFYEYTLLPEEVEAVTSAGVRVYFLSTSVSSSPASVIQPEWTTPVAAAWLVTPIEDRR